MLEPPTEPAAPSDAVFGIDNVAVELPVASLGSRCLAMLLDSVVLILLQALLATAILLLVDWVGLSTGLGFTVLGLGMFLLQWGYFATLEIAMRGETPGKRVMGLRVVSGHGGLASTPALLIRNLFRGLDLLLGAPLMFLDRKSRRIGDLVAGTLVAHQTDDRDEPSRIGRLPEGWGAREAAVLEGLLARADRLGGERSEQLAQRLVAHIERESPDFLQEIGDGPALGRLRRALQVSDA